MKILFTLTQAFDPNAGGVQRTTFKLGQYFTEQGIEVSYFSTSNQGHVSSKYGTLYHTKEGGGQGNKENIAELERIVSKISPDVVINQMPYETNLTNILSQLKSKVGYVLLGCLRNSLFNFKSNARDEMMRALPGPVFNLMDNKLGLKIVQKRHWFRHRGELKEILDKHDKFILLAPPNRQELKYFVGDYKKDKVLSIPNSIPEIYLGMEPKEKIVLHVGRLNIPQKRSDLLLDFWENCYKQLPDWKFVIVGDGPYKEKLELDLKKRNLDRVYLEGYQQPEDYYKRAAVFMIPSAYEGFPNTILEAQSFGCLTVAFNSYLALDWIVNDGIDACLIPPFECDRMAEELISIIESPNRLEAMQAASKDNAARFTIDQVGQLWLQLFKEIGIDG
jgi:glycosyltransferase involved in cell wall biosynthesis